MDIQAQVVEVVNKVVKGTGVAKGVAITDILDLAGKNLTHREIGRLLGISQQCVSKRLKAFAPRLKLLNGYKRHRADMLTLKQAEIMDAMTPDKIEAASLLQMTTAIGILHDKERMERGQSTANIDIHCEVRQALERVQALREAVESEEIESAESGEIESDA